MFIPRPITMFKKDKFSNLAQVPTMKVPLVILWHEKATILKKKRYLTGKVMTGISHKCENEKNRVATKKVKTIFTIKG